AAPPRCSSPGPRRSSMLSRSASTSSSRHGSTWVARLGRAGSSVSSSVSHSVCTMRCYPTRTRRLRAAVEFPANIRERAKHRVYREKTGTRSSPAATQNHYRANPMQYRSKLTSTIIGVLTLGSLVLSGCSDDSSGTEQSGNTEDTSTSADGTEDESGTNSGDGDGDPGDGDGDPGDGDGDGDPGDGDGDSGDGDGDSGDGDGDSGDGDGDSGDGDGDSGDGDGDSGDGDGDSGDGDGDGDLCGTT